MIQPAKFILSSLSLLVLLGQAHAKNTDAVLPTSIIASSSSDEVVGSDHDDIAKPTLSIHDDMPNLEDESIRSDDLEPEHNTWFDDTRDDTKSWLNRTAHRLDGWFGTTNPKNPARASIRLMLDANHNQHDGTTVKPRIRGRISLPTLEDRLSVMIGDDDLDLEQGGGVYNDERLVSYGETTFDERQARKDNSSLALRWSKLQEDIGVEMDTDIGLRSDDLYLKFRAEKKWSLDHNIHSRFEQVYRYGTKSEHYALSTLEFAQPQSKHRTLINRSHLSYAHQDSEEVAWGNTLYQQHYLEGKHGTREFSYGLYAGGDIVDSSAEINIYGPYISYRQPIWRKWLFVQTDLSYYNNKALERDHHMGVFSRVEVVF